MILVPVFLGIFAIAEVINRIVSDRYTISGKTRVEELGGSVWEGICAIFKNFGLFIRCSVIGTVIGMIPGIGATVASFIAYSPASRSPHPSRTNSWKRADDR